MCGPVDPSDRRQARHVAPLQHHRISFQPVYNVRHRIHHFYCSQDPSQAFRSAVELVKVRTDYFAHQLMGAKAMDLLIRRSTLSGPLGTPRYHHLIQEHVLLFEEEDLHF